MLGTDGVIPRPGAWPIASPERRDLGIVAAQKSKSRSFALLRTTKKQVLGRTEGCHPERSEGSRFRSAIPNNCRVKTEILRAKKQPSG